MHFDSWFDPSKGLQLWSLRRWLIVNYIVILSPSVGMVSKQNGARDGRLTMDSAREASTPVAYTPESATVSLEAAVMTNFT